MFGLCEGRIFPLPCPFPLPPQSPRLSAEFSSCGMGSLWGAELLDVGVLPAVSRPCLSRGTQAGTAGCCKLPSSCGIVNMPERLWEPGQRRDQASGLPAVPAATAAVRPGLSVAAGGQCQRGPKPAASCGLGTLGTPAWPWPGTAHEGMMTAPRTQRHRKSRAAIETGGSQHGAPGY